MPGAGGGATVTAGHHASRAPLRLVDTPPHGSFSWGELVGGRWFSASHTPLVGIAVAVAVVFGLLAVVRVSQGAPPADSWAELTADPQEPALALVGPGDHIRVARPGDTFWALAQELAPDRDPRPVVDALVVANGGSSIQVGQRLVIPAELVASSDSPSPSPGIGGG